MKRNIIFVDFDGVLVTEESYYKRRHHRNAPNPEKHAADPDAIRNLNSVVAASNARIVVSSAWRMTRDKDELLVLLRQWGGEGDFIGPTPVMLSNTRGQEIAAWVKRHAESIREFVILDDDPRT